MFEDQGEVVCGYSKSALRIVPRKNSQIRHVIGYPTYLMTIFIQA